MVARTARPAPGDLLEIAVPGGRGIVQYVGEHHGLGGTIWVVPRILPPGSEVTPALMDQGYYIFFPVRPAVQKGLARIVGRADLGERSVPTDGRRPGAIDASGAILTWIVSEDGKDRVVERLSDAERALPIEEIWNLEMLAGRIAEGWHPDREDTTPALHGDSADSQGGEERALVHYLYFPTRERASTAREEIALLGFTVELRPGALGPDWLVKATSQDGTVIQDPASQSETLRDIATRAGGEYDGWEHPA